MAVRGNQHSPARIGSWNGPGWNSVVSSGSFGNRARTVGANPVMFNRWRSAALAELVGQPGRVRVLGCHVLRGPLYGLLDRQPGCGVKLLGDRHGAPCQRGRLVERVEAHGVGGLEHRDVLVSLGEVNDRRPAGGAQDVRVGDELGGLAGLESQRWGEGLRDLQSTLDESFPFLAGEAGRARFTRQTGGSLEGDQGGVVRRRVDLAHDERRE